MLVLAALLLANVGCGRRQATGGGAGGEAPGGAGRAGGSVPIEVPDPLSGDNPGYPEPELPEPETGVTFGDPCFFTPLAKATEAEGISGRHKYSRFDPFNAGGSKIHLVRDDGDYAVYRTGTMPYSRTGNPVLRTSGLAEPRRDREDPKTLRGLDGFEVVGVDVAGGRREVVKDFAADPAATPILAAEPDICRATTQDEGGASCGFRYWTLIQQGVKDGYQPRCILCWGREEDEVLGLYEIPPGESGIDRVGMSPLGNWVLVGGMEGNAGSLAGLTLADRGLTRFHRIGHTTSHADVGLDAGGGEVVVVYRIPAPTTWT